VVTTGIDQGPDNALYDQDYLPAQVGAQWAVTGPAGAFSVTLRAAAGTSLVLARRDAFIVDIF
jgi:hypothetical protein